MKTALTNQHMFNPESLQRSEDIETLEDDYENMLRSKIEPYVDNIQFAESDIKQAIQKLQQLGLEGDASQIRQAAYETLQQDFIERVAEKISIIQPDEVDEDLILQTIQNIQQE